MHKVKPELGGLILTVKVKVGDTVSIGQELATTEMMKMQYPLLSTATGTITKIYFKQDDFIEENEVFCDIEEKP